jgi:anti-sigma factor RsiW
MTCDAARELLSALVDEELSVEQTRELRAHLAGCADCRRELEALRSTVALVRSVPPVRAPIGFVDRVLAAARPTPWYRRLARRLFVPLRIKVPIEAAAVVVVAIIAVHLFRETRELELATRREAPQSAVSDVTQTTAAPAAPAAPSPPAQERQATHAKIPEATIKRDQESSEVARDRKQATDLPPTRGDAANEQASRGAIKSEGLPSQERAAGAESSASLHRLQSAAAPERRSSEASAVDVAGRLAVTDRAVAESALVDLTSRLGGVIVGRRTDADATVVDVRVPRTAYDQLMKNLASIGRWTPERETAPLPEHVRVSLRLIL